MTKFAVGDIVEVEAVVVVDGSPGWEECTRTRRCWIQATVQTAEPLEILRDDGIRQALTHADPIRHLKQDACHD
jgi:hypothetical protein